MPSVTAVADFLSAARKASMRRHDDENEMKKQQPASTQADPHGDGSSTVAGAVDLTKAQSVSLDLRCVST